MSCKPKQRDWKKIDNEERNRSEVEERRVEKEKICNEPVCANELLFVYCSFTFNILYQSIVCAHSLTHTHTNNWRKWFLITQHYMAVLFDDELIDAIWVIHIFVSVVVWLLCLASFQFYWSRQFIYIIFYFRIVRPNFQKKRNDKKVTHFIASESFGISRSLLICMCYVHSLKFGFIAVWCFFFFTFLIGIHH